MERPERPTRHRSNPIVKPKLPTRPSFSSDSESEHNDENAPTEEMNSYYRSVDSHANDGPSTSSGMSQTATSSEAPGERKMGVRPGFSLPPVMKGLIQTRPMEDLLDEEGPRPEPQGQESTVRSRKRSAATAAANVIFDTVDSLINASTNTGTERSEQSSTSPERQEFQHNDFVIRPRSFCSIEYCNSSGARVPYKHKRLNAPIDLTSGLSPASSSRSGAGMSSGVTCLRGEPNDSSSFLSRSSPLYQRRENLQQPGCSSSILRQFDELNSTSPNRRTRRSAQFSVRFCDNPIRYDVSNEDSNNITLLSSEPGRSQRNSNLEDYCDLVGNFLFNYPSSHLPTGESSRSVNQPMDIMPPSTPPYSPPLAPPPPPGSVSPLSVLVEGHNMTPDEPRRTTLIIPDIVNDFMDSGRSNTSGDVGAELEVETHNDDVILVETPERAGGRFSPRSPSYSPCSPRPLSPPPVHYKSQSSGGGSDVPMTLQELNQTLVSLLECPVCLDHATPPIYQCCKGHLICQSCHPRLSICPICRSRLPGDRNSSMEKVAEKLMYPCKNTLTGCTMMLKLDDKQSHEEGCGFRHYPCILPSCHWKGYKPELVVHLQSDHPEKLIDGASKEVHVPLSVPLGGGMFVAHHWIQAAHNEVFNVIFHVDLYKRVMKGCVTYIGAPERADKFMFQFELKQRASPFRQLMYSRTTLADSHKPSQQLNMSNDFSINIDMARMYRHTEFPAHAIPVTITIKTAPSPPPTPE